MRPQRQSVHRRSPSKRATCRDTGSITPLIIGMALVLFLLGLGVAVLGSAFLTHQNLQNLCDGAASVAANAVRPDLVDDEQAAAPAAAARRYLAGHGHDVGVARLALRGGSVHVTCTQTLPLSAAGLFDLPAQHTFAVEAVSRPVLLG